MKLAMLRIILALAIIGSFFIQCQPTKSTAAAKKTAEEDKMYQFPEDWTGEWEGQLNIYNAKGKTMDVYMGLNILPIEGDKYSFTIIYGQGEKAQERKYEIFPKDTARGHYIVDEKNAILLDDFLLGNTLYSRFEVMGSLLLASYERGDGTITFEVVSGSVEPMNATGGVDSIPKVNSYPIVVAQKAVLKRKK
jgi:hypothetical protein